MQYEDPQRHFKHSINQAADRYARGLQRAGLKQNERLTRAVAERAVMEAREDYERHAHQQLEGRIGHILDDYDERDRQIRRSGARLAWIICPLAVLLFAVCAWFNWHEGDRGTTLLYGVGALAFLVMLTLAHRQGKR